MTAVRQEVLYFFMFMLFLSTFSDTQFTLFSNFYNNVEKKVIGKLDEDVILPCSFENESEVTVIHWKIQDTGYVHSYYQGHDHLGNQDPRYKKRTALFHNEIHNGNASLYLRRLSRKDEGTYSCYVGTTSGKFRKSVVLQVGAFVTPVMKYEKRDTSSMLICSILSVYPRPSITWHMDNISITDSRVEEIGSLGSFHINSTVNVTGSKSPYECAIKNSLLEQTWTGHWMMKDDLHKMQSEQVSFSCDVANNLFQQNQDIIVTWSRMENGTSFILAKFESASQNIVTNEPRLSWEKELINQGHFSSTLKELEILDNGEYLCHISSSNYTFLTLQTLHVDQRVAVWEIVIPVVVVVVVVLPIIVLMWRRHTCPCTESKRRNHPGKEDNAEMTPFKIPNSGEADGK